MEDCMELDYTKDCCFLANNNWFRYRAAAIIIENGCVLLASNDVANYFYSVGGGVHLGETAEEAVIREVFEETGVQYEIDRLAFIHENFFYGDGATKDLKCHEVAFYFIMKQKGSQVLNSNSICAEGKEYMNWIPICDLKKYTVFPSFFAEKLNNLSNGIEHIVTHEL